MEKETKNYEITWLSSPLMEEKEAFDYFNKIKKIITDKNGLPKDEELPKKINLSYPVRKLRAAFISTINFEANGESILSIKELLEKEEKVIRYLIIKKKKTKKEEKTETKKAVKKKTKEKEEKEGEKKENSGKKEKIEKIEEKIDKIIK